MSVLGSIWFYKSVIFGIVGKLLYNYMLRCIWIYCLFGFIMLLDYKFISFRMYCGFDIRNVVILEIFRYNIFLLL